MVEEWRDIPGWEGIYQISNLARIRCIRVTYFNGDDFGDYIRVTLSDGERKERYPLHRLVATVFVKNNTNKPIVNHKDGNKKNNLPNNLEWSTYSENTTHAIKTGLMKVARGETCNKKLTEKNVYQIIELISQGMSNPSIAKMFNVNSSLISQIRNNHIWKHIERN